MVRCAVSNSGWYCLGSKHQHQQYMSRWADEQMSIWVDELIMMLTLMLVLMLVLLLMVMLSRWVDELMLMLLPQAVRPGEAHVTMYHRPSDGQFLFLRILWLFLFQIKFGIIIIIGSQYLLKCPPQRLQQELQEKSWKQKRSFRGLRIKL